MPERQRRPMPEGEGLSALAGDGGETLILQRENGLANEPVRWDLLLHKGEGNG